MKRIENIITGQSINKKPHTEDELKEGTLVFVYQSGIHKIVGKKYFVNKITGIHECNFKYTQICDKKYKMIKGKKAEKVNICSIRWISIVTKEDLLKIKEEMVKGIDTVLDML